MLTRTLGECGDWFQANYAGLWIEVNTPMSPTDCRTTEVSFSVWGLSTFPASSATNDSDNIAGLSSDEAGTISMIINLSPS